MTLVSARVTLPLAERYRDRLPLAADAKIVSLGEGSTPLLPAPRLSERTGVEVWLKWEGANPTGSFKDRGMTVAVTQALEDGAHAVVCASTGNTAASAAAYAARAGLEAVILQPEGAVARGKLAQARAVGARVRDPREFRGGARRGEGARRCGDTRPRQLAQPAPPPGPEDGSVRDRRGARQRARRPRTSVRRRREPLRLRARLRGARRASPLRRRAGRRPGRDRSLRDPHRRARRTRRRRSARWPTRAARRRRLPTRRSSTPGAFSPAKRASSASPRRPPAWPLSSRIRRERARVVCVITGHGLKDPDAVGA